MADRALSPSQARNALVGLRLSLGAGWLAPVPLSKAFGLRGAALEPTLPFLMRLFASRDVALGALTLLTSGKARRTVLTVGVVVDASDAVAGVLSGRSGKTGVVPTALVTGTAIAAAALGVAALRD